MLRDASSAAVVSVVQRSCHLPSEDSLQLPSERVTTRGRPPAHTATTGPLRQGRLLPTRVDERPTNALVRFPVRPESESLSGGRMVGELAQPRLQSAEPTDAGRDLRRRRCGGEQFQRIPELLRMNSQPVDLAIITKAVVEVIQKPPHKPSRPTASEGDDRLGRRSRLDSNEQRGGLAVPVAGQQVGDLVLEFLPRRWPLLRQHLHKVLSGCSTGGGWPCRRCRPATRGEYVEIASFSGRAADPAERLLEPATLTPWHERPESRDGGGRTTGGNP